MKLQYGRFMYYFQLEDGEMRVFYGEGGFSDEAATGRALDMVFSVSVHLVSWRHG